MTTKLDAVNQMLAAVGSLPVSTLANNTNPEVALAVQMLDQTTLDLLQEGWNFNTDTQLEFVPDSNDGDRIAIDGASYLAVSENHIKSSRYDLVIRGGYLWDRVKRTDAFENPVWLDVKRNMAFEDMPSPARSYAAARAARLFQAQVNGDRMADASASAAEVQARGNLLDEEHRSNRSSLIKYAPAVAGRTGPLDYMRR